MTGGVALENPFPNPANGWLSDKSWAEIVRCSEMAAFNGLRDHFKSNVSEEIYLKYKRYHQFNVMIRCYLNHVKKYI